MGRQAKRWLILLLVLQVLVGITGCGDKADEQIFSGTVYVPEFLEFDISELGIEYINTGCCDGENVYILADASFEIEEKDPVTGETYTNYEYRTTIFRFSLDGGEAVELENFAPASESEETPADRESYSYIESLSIGTDGTLWVTESTEEYIYDVPEDFDPENDYLWNYEMIDNRRTQLRRQLDSTGKEIARVDSGGLQEVVLGDADGYIGNSIIDNNGNYYVFVETYNENSYETKIVVLDSEQEALFEIKENDLWGQMVLLSDGTVAMSRYIYDQFAGTGEQVLQTIDLEEKTWGVEYTLPANVGNIYTGGGDYLFYYDNGDSLYGYDGETEEGKRLLSWSSADINVNNLCFFTFLEDGRVAAMTRSWGENGMEAELAILTETDASVLADKTILTYATMYLDYETRERIIDFNKSQNACRIEIRDYAEFNTADDYTAGLTKLNTEIIAGQVPDLLDTDQLPIRQYGAKGLLEDLWPYIEKDEELGGREALMENVLKAAEQEGKLYQIFNSFTIRTVTGAASVVGEDMSWTLEELQAALDTMPEGCSIFSEGDTKESMLSNVLALNLDSFVDWSSGQCSFDSEDFIALLEFCDTFPLNYDYTKVDWEDYGDEPSRIADGRQMLCAEYLYDLQYIQVSEAMFGGDITYVGYPAENGRIGSSFAISSGIAMSSTCKDKDAAWSFMRETLLPQSSEEDEYFYFNGWGFPVNKQDFDRVAERYMTPMYRYDENGDILLDENGDPVEESQGGYGWETLMVEIYATTQEQYDQVMELYEAIDTVYTYDEKIYAIVLEVAQRYFNGDITSQAAAEQIQSRVKLYVNENL